MSLRPTSQEAIFIGWWHALSTQTRVLLTIYSLFDRAKWTQEPVPSHEKNNRKTKFQNFDLKYNLGGEERTYDVKVGVHKNVGKHRRSLQTNDFESG